MSAADPAPVPEAAKKLDTTAELLARLHKPHDFESSIDTTPFQEVAQFIQAKCGIPIVINDRAFKEISGHEGRETHVKVRQLKGLPLVVGFRDVLTQMDATFLVRRGHLEIVPIAFAAQETKSALVEGEQPRLKEPLVSVIFKEKAFNEVVAELAEEYDLNVIVSPQSGDSRMGFVTARMLNVPADKALELLAVQVDLRVIRKGNVFLITSRDHANDMVNERLEKEKQQIEVEKLRAEIAKPPEPPKPPETPEVPKADK